MRTSPVPGDRPAVLLACYLPSPAKAYVVEEILAQVEVALDRPDLYVGVQHGSHPSTESVVRSLTSEWRVEVGRVPPEQHVDSDAAAFVEALRLARDAGRSAGRYYFIHTKGITSDNDDLRRDLLQDLLDTARVDDALASPRVGSYGPHLTITRADEDRAAMRAWIRRFVPGRTLPTLPYFYAHTLWVAKGACVEEFLGRVDRSFFETPVPEFSDRYFAERDLPHLVDAVCGKRPSFGRLAGNHSTGYRRTRRRELAVELARWELRSSPARVRRALGLLIGR